ncbi:MAG: RNA polymerase factor sigma-70 [Epulopiscium sp. Nele67-Bin005]|nr:MAG: RNA polymerase factor sigma-70 [Epulopiscium sp. Nele67-Bin005]
MVKLEELTDEELIETYNKQNLEAVDILIRRYKTYVRQKIRTSYFIGSERDDLVQEGMIGLFKAICDYKPSKQISFKQFAQICIKRQISTAFTMANRKKHIPLNTSISLNQPITTEEAENLTLLDLMAENTTPEDLVISNEQLQILNDKIKNVLSNFEFEVLTLHLKGQPYQDIAIILDKSPKSIDNALQRIKRKINTALQK